MEFKGINQLQVAELSWIPRPTVSRHISGERLNVSLEIAVKYERAFCIPKVDFVFLNNA